MFKKIAAIAALITVSGCSQHYIVTSQFVAEDLNSEQAEVIETPSYHDSLKRIKRLAVLPPDSCINEGASKSSGTSKNEDTVLKTNCGVEMALLERQLAKNGFQVISWKVLSRKIASLEPLEAAKQLGAHALLQINALERSTINSGKDARWDRRYFNSNVKGSILDSVQLPPNKANQMDRYASFGEQMLIQKMNNRLSATLNASVTSVKTGETIWFYSWTVAEKFEEKQKAKSHLVCSGNSCSPFRKNNSVSYQPHAEVIRSGTSHAVSMKRSVEDERAVDYQKLLTMVVKDLVSQFAGKK